MCLLLLGMFVHRQLCVLLCVCFVLWRDGDVCVPVSEREVHTTCVRGAGHKEVHWVSELQH